MTTSPPTSTDAFSEHLGAIQARSPFRFNSAAYLLRIGREHAATLGELVTGLRECPEGSIFQHTFRTLQEHHFIREGYSNDFAHWAYTACQEAGLAERLASIDVRAFTSIPDLRERIVQVVSEYLMRNPKLRDRPASKAFYFCSSETVTMPTSFVAHNLNEFVGALREVSIHSVHYHFIEARLRLKLRSNDFSRWLEEEMKMGQVAGRLDQIDIYTATLEDVRRQLIKIIQSAIR